MLFLVTPLALLGLGWHALVVQPLKRLRARGSGLARFSAAYASDGLRPTPEGERATHGAASRCIGCGLCDDGQRLAGDPEMAPALLALGRPAAFRLAGRRSADAALDRALLDAWAARPAPPHRCPTGVPLDRVIEALRLRPVAPAAPPG